jgi:hypothetical protein
VRAQLAHGVAQLLVTDRGGDVRAGRAAELDRGRADTTRSAVDEQALAGLQARLREDRVVGGGEHLGHAPGLRPVEVLGDGHQLALLHDRQLRLAPTADDRHHAVALAEALRTRAERGDLAGQLEPRDVRRRTWRRGVAALALEHVRAVEPRRAYAHEHLAGAGLGVRALLDGHVSVGDHGSPHGAAV